MSSDGNAQGMSHSRSAALLVNKNSSWANLKQAETLKKRSNTAQNLQFYVEEQKRLYEELPFMAIPGMRSSSIQRQRSQSNLRPKSSWGSFTNLAQRGEEQQGLLDRPSKGEPDDDLFFDEPGYTRALLSSCGIALLSAFQFGFNTGVTGALNPNVVFPGHSSFQWSLCVSAFAIGGPVGSIVAGYISSIYGRKHTIIANAFLFMLAGLLMLGAPTIEFLIFGRFIVGFSAGMVSVVVPLYLGELAPPNLRGALGTGYQFSVVLGILTVDLFAFVFGGPSAGIHQPGWRALFGLTIVPALLQVAFSSLLNESPRWLLTQNKPKDAADILRHLRGTSDVYEEIDSICSASDQESSGNMGVLDVLRDRSIRYALIVGIMLQVAQQFSGINGVIFYANSFFLSVGLQSPLVGTTLVGAVNALSTGVALLLMDRVGRRPLLLWSCMGMFVSSVVLTLAMLHVFPHSSMVSVGAMMAYVWFFEIGLGPIPWLIVAEMFPAPPRPTAISIATMVNWICSFIIGLGFPFLQETLVSLAFVPFALVLLVSFGCTYYYVPETKGKTLEEIQRELRS